MKKLFLIPLMALMTCVMAWGKDAHVSDITGLKAAIEDASVETIYLDADINNYKGTATGSEIRILRSVTIDGQGHTIKGYGKRTSSVGNVFSINQGGSSMVDVIFRNINMIINFPATSNDRLARVIETRGNIRSIELDNVTMGVEDETKTIAVGLQLGGNQASKANITITNSTISVGKSGYPVLSWNPYIMTASNSTFSGYCGLYFKGVNSSAGSAGSVVNADACDFDAPNVHDPAGGWNNFGVFAQEDANITINLHNCGMNAQETGLKANQGMILPQQVGFRVNISGDNSHINGRMVLENANYPGYYLALLELTGGLTITGGTYSVDPSHYGPYNPYTWFGDQDPTLPNEDLYANFVPEGYEVAAVKQGDVTLYRVVKKAQEKEPGVLYDLNDYVPVEGVDEGNNPVSSFELSDGAEDKTLNNEKTYAGYVEIKDHATEGKTVLTVDKTLDDKDQRLIINKGLDVQGESQVVVKAGAAVIIGEGGINTEKPENIVIESTEDEQAALLLDPTISVNKNPELTVRLTTNSKMLTAAPTYLYQRMAIPVLEGMRPHNEFDDEGHGGHSLFPGQSTFYSYFYKWGGHEWEPIESWGDLNPYVGYQMSNNSADGGVIYTFTGNLIGNDDAAYEFTSKGFEFFGNSYTAPIVIKNLLDGFAENSPGVEATVYVYVYGDYNTWVPITSEDIEEGFALATEIRSMDCFILNLRNGNSGTANMSYADAIWNNPRINPSVPAAGAPARAYASSIDNSVVISVTSEGGQGDRLTLIERQTNDATFENGADASKFITDGVNIYAETPAGQLSRVATNNLEGTQITFASNASEQFTLKFSNVNGTRYALRDNANGQIISLVDDATYNFTQAANTSVANRFEVVAVEHVVTGVESTKANSGVKGIYTVLGQYVGSHSQWNSLPAGVYVVDGVKMVK